MMGNHAEHVAVIFALMSLRAVWVPVNPRLRGRPLEYQIEAADPYVCLADGELAARRPQRGGRPDDSDLAAGPGPPRGSGGPWPEP